MIIFGGPETKTQVLQGPGAEQLVLPRRIRVWGVEGLGGLG